MKSKTETILIVLNVLVWIVFIGLLIETGAIFVSYLVSAILPDAAKNLYKGLDFLELRNSSLWEYSVMVSILIAISALKSYTAFLVLEIFTRIKLVDPFKIEIAQLMEKVSYYILTIWIVSVLAKSAKEILVHSHITLRISTDSGEYLFLAGIIYIFAQIFKRGVEIQAENELTV
jgi:hypothetical protein